MRLLRHILGDQAGSVATIFALATPLLIGGATLAIDATAMVNTGSHLQGVADAAALAGAKELHVYRRDFSAVEERVEDRALAMLAEKGMNDAAPEAEVTVDGEAATVTVTLTASPATLMLGTLGLAQPSSATAVAHAFGSARLCVLALDESGGGAIHAMRLATIEAAECAVQSNSGQSDAIDLELLSSIKALSICSSGGVDGPPTAFEPEPATDCPTVENPLADQTLPAVGPCDHDDMKIILPRTIQPGHYCGGLTLGPTALVTAAPGEYVISGGPLELLPASSLVGDGVSFRFVDEEATFDFGLGSIVRLSAPTDGPMAGFLFFQDTEVEKGQTFFIGTDLATKLLGTVYLPSGTLKIDVIGLVAAQSAYTVVVADRIDVNGAHLVINSDYGATDVPVPAGVGPTGGQVALAR